MAGIVRNTKTVDSHRRVALPKEWAVEGDIVYFEITKSGNLIIHKINKKESDKEISL